MRPLLLVACILASLAAQAQHKPAKPASPAPAAPAARDYLQGCDVVVLRNNKVGVRCPEKPAGVVPIEPGNWAARPARPAQGATIIEPSGDGAVVLHPGGRVTICNRIGDSLVCS